MMIEREELLQLVTLGFTVLLFDYLERRRPGFSVDRKWNLSLNLFALLVVIVAGEACKMIVLAGLRALSFDDVRILTDIRMLPGAVKIVLGVILADFSLYWVHRAMHRPGLWPTHAFHHTIEELWWLSGSRTSVTHLLLFAVPQMILAYFILALTPGESGIAFSLGVVVNVWIHTNLWVNLGPLEWIFITPNYHRIHHGTKGYTRMNLGFVFTVWDRMFGTYADPRETGKDFALFAVPTRSRLLRMITGF